MTISKVVKRVALCFLSAILLTAIFCLAVLISAVLGDFNEYIVCCLAGILHSAIIFNYKDTQPLIKLKGR